MYPPRRRSSLSVLSSVLTKDQSRPAQRRKIVGTCLRIGLSIALLSDTNCMQVPSDDESEDEPVARRKPKKRRVLLEASRQCKFWLSPP